MKAKLTVENMLNICGWKENQDDIQSINFTARSPESKYTCIKMNCDAALSLNKITQETHDELMKFAESFLK